MPATLSAAQLSKLSTPGLYRAERNLYLQIHRNGARSWVLRYQAGGRRRVMGLGPVRIVPLTEARARALRAQRDLLDGKDPIDARRAERAPIAAPKAIPTFEEVAEAYIEDQRAGWRNAKHAYQWSQSLKSYAYPTIGHLPVSDVTIEHVVTILRPIWAEKPETAGRVRNRIENVLESAIAAGHRPAGVNPASWRGPLRKLLPALSKVQTVEHHAAVPHAEVPTLYQQVARSGSVAAKALAFTILTVVRSGEARGMRFRELDRDAKTWTIPRERTKTGVEQVVPLSNEALALLPKAGKSDALVFPGTKAGQPLSDMTLLKLIRSLRGDGATVHGLRSSFRTWTGEKTDFPDEIAEASLGHAVKGQVRRAYLRTTFMDKRRALMTDWAAFCISAKIN